MLSGRDQLGDNGHKCLGRRPQHINPPKLPHSEASKLASLALIPDFPLSRISYRHVGAESFLSHPLTT